jgi:hypothetical protein
MAFKVRLAGRAVTDGAMYDTEDMYQFLEGGVLAIRFADTTKWTEYYPPHKWEQVLAEPNHPPGRPGGETEVWAFRE